MYNRGYMYTLRNLKKKVNFFLKNQKFDKSESGSLIKQPKKQEVAQDDTVPMLHLL